MLNMRFVARRLLVVLGTSSLAIGAISCSSQSERFDSYRYEPDYGYERSYRRPNYWPSPARLNGPEDPAPRQQTVD